MYGYGDPASVGFDAHHVSQTLGTPTLPVALEQPKVYHIPAWKHFGDPRKLALIRRVAESRGRDPRIAVLAVNILKQAGVEPRNYVAQAAALLRWVQGNIYYVNEPDERLQDPEYTLKVGMGDCLPADTLVLRDDHQLVPVAQIKEGDRIWGRDAWTGVRRIWPTGKKKVTHLRLSNGSILRASENHKVFVWACELHGPSCPDFLVAGRANCTKRGFRVEEIPVADLQVGMRLLRPDRIEAGSVMADPGLAYMDGLYLADGWIQHEYKGVAYDFAIAGKDGHPKQAQKAEVQAYFAARGIETRWHKRFITVKDRALAARYARWGGRAFNKALDTIAYTKEAGAELLRGLMADAGLAKSGTLVYSTTSDVLALQTRLLYKMQGISCSMRRVADHGGLGTHPIWRMSPYQDRRGGPYGLIVKEIDREVEEAECWDLTTDDAYVYLPESDAVVHNCDDCVLLLCTLFESIRFSWRLVLSGPNGNGQVVRWVEGTPMRDRGKWSHIYCCVGDRPFSPKRWIFAEPTLRYVPLGWDIVAAKGKLPEFGGNLAGASDAAASMTAAMVAADVSAEDEPDKSRTAFLGLDWQQIATAVIVGVSSGVLTRLALKAIIGDEK